MIGDPPILILDEPTVGLDPVQIRETLALIKDLGREHTILLSTHILPEVEAVCQRVIIIDRGRVKRDMRLSELGTEPTNIVVEARGPSDQIVASLGAMDGVLRVDVKKLSDGVARYDVHLREPQDLREQIGERLFKNSWPIRRLDHRVRRLDEVFVQVVARDADGAGAGESE
jgi:ABC-2 type transport system ATP-binding protein